MFFGLLYLFPKLRWRLIATFWSRHWDYFRNLIPFAWIVLGTVLLVNTVLSIFYVIDIWAIGNNSKYSVYWTANGSDSPLLNFCSIIGFGAVLYWVVGVVSYRKFWLTHFKSSIREMIRNS
ncbi:hypothetical protein [Candidatus Mycoplasma haematominutum]|nr:hypothetical protein [Candidatus Mycoplasma haematominutum]